MNKSINFRFSLVTLLFFLFVSFVNKTVAQELSLCSDYYFLPTKKNKKANDTTCVIIYNGFIYNKAEQIVKLANLPMNFIVCKTGYTKNAFATMDKNGNRFIKYDDAFIQKLNSDSTALESTIILAHEIGHHIFSHFILTDAHDLVMNYKRNGLSDSTYARQRYKDYEEKYNAARRMQELEADRFAGFIMAKKGVSFDRVEKFYRKLDKHSDGKKEFSHPPIDSRIEALRQGFHKRDTISTNQTINLSQFGEERMELVFHNPGVIERNKLLKKIKHERYSLLQKIQDKAIQAATVPFTKLKYKFNCSISQASRLEISSKLPAISTYLGEKFEVFRNSNYIDDEVEYCIIHQAKFTLTDVENITYSFPFMLHVKSDYFYLILFDNAEGVTVAYKSRFSDDQISYEEIKLLFSRKFKSELQKAIDDQLK